MTIRIANERQYSEGTSLTNFARIYQQRLTKHAQTVRAEHDKKCHELVQINIDLQKYVEIHQQLLGTHTDAQEQVNTLQVELDEICKKNVLLMTGQSALDASGDALGQTCTETFKALALEHRAQTLANVASRQETEAKLVIAQAALNEAEEAVSPSLLHIENEQSRIKAFKEITEELTKYMMRAEFLQTLTEAGPSAIATLESVLQNNITLKDVADMVQKDKKAAEANDQPIIEPTD
jgi:heme exporter protein D